MVRPDYLEFIERSGNEFYHFGTKEHSGRYPWGSGERPKQRLEKAKNKHFTKERKEKLKKVGKDVGRAVSSLVSTGASVANIGIDLMEIENKAEIDKAIRLASSKTISGTEIYKDKDLKEIYSRVMSDAWGDHDDVDRKERKAYVDAISRALKREGKEANEENIMDYGELPFGRKKIFNLLDDKDFRKIIEESIDKYERKDAKEKIRKYIENDYRRNYDVGSDGYFGLSEAQLKREIDSETEKLLKYL